MASERNKIAMGLSAEQLREFVALCASTPKLTLERIKELAAGRGIEISLMSAKAFRDTTYQRHLDRLRRATELSERIAAAAAGGASDPGRTIADAAAAELASQVFDLLVSAGEAESLDSKEARRLAMTIGTLRQGNIQTARLLQRIREYEEKRDALREKIASARRTTKGGITRETLEEIERAAALL